MIPPFERLRSRPLRTALAGTAVLGAAAAVAVAGAPAQAVTAAALPAHYAAPYLELSNSSAGDMAADLSATGDSRYTLAFLIPQSGCTAMWEAGSYPVGSFTSQISSLKASGGDVVISFGGAAGGELAQTCTDVGSLTAAYKNIVTTYGVTRLDFDIEGGVLGDTAATTRRDQALAALQQQVPGLQVDFTLAVDPTGLPGDQINLLNDAKNQGVNVSVVNLMTMDYYDGQPVINDALSSARGAASQIASLYGISTSAAYAKEGLTPIAGKNDDGAMFSQSDAQTLETFAANNGVAELSFWEVDSYDKATGYAYSRIFNALTGSSGGGGGGGGGTGPITGYQGLCLDDRSASTANFNPIQVYTCNGTNAQNWTVNTSTNTLQVLGKCLDVNAAGTADGTTVDLYDCNGTGAQVWVPQSNGELLNPNSGKCLDDTGYGGSGTQAQIWSCADTANQKWTLPTSSGGGGGIPHPDFGPNVTVFDPSMAASTIQADINNVYNAQVNNEFGTQRNALLFAPGTYNVDVPVGYNTEVAGLGLSPDQVNITGGTVHVFGHTSDGNATQNFWRDAENMEVSPPSGSTMWAVSQADPFRRMDVNGGMLLYDNVHGSGGNWSSGGYVGDSRISGQIDSGTQQQFLTQDTAMNGGWTGSNWNMVFVGDTNAPSTTFPNPPYTTVAQSPTNREKPFIYVDGSGTWQVFVPALRTNAGGPDWTNGTAAGTSIPVSSFYIVKPGDTSDTINAALSQGKSLIVTPGVYHLASALNITSPDTVVLGLGMATLVPDNGNAAITTADVDGIDIAGLLISANSTNSDVLMQIGPSGSSAGHAADPTELQDIFFRIGGDQAAQATRALVVNSDNVIGDDLWLWRADHTYGVGWTVNPAQNGLVVNGDNVTMYGLAVEHFEKYQTEWFGNGGRTYFYQSECPYDVPDQGSWVPPNGAEGYASYLVGPSVTSHEAWGLGIYAYFRDNPSVVLDHAVESPNTSGVKFHDMVTTVLGGDGTINHQVNETGGQVTPSHNVSYLVSYP